MSVCAARWCAADEMLLIKKNYELIRLNLIQLKQNQPQGLKKKHWF